MTVAQGLCLVASYLIGAIPTSYVAARAFGGIDQHPFPGALDQIQLRDFEFQMRILSDG